MTALRKYFEELNISDNKELDQLLAEIEASGIETCNTVEYGDCKSCRIAGDCFAIDDLINEVTNG